MKIALRSFWYKFRQKLDGIAMYRTVTYALSFLVFCTLFLGVFNVIPYTFWEQGLSLSVVLLVCSATNLLSSKIWRVKVNQESAYITALILFFVVSPPLLSDWVDLWQIALVGFLAIASKFVIAWRKQHIFNPAAIGVILFTFISLFFDLQGYLQSGWWIGLPEMFLPLLLAGFVVVNKIRKWTPVLTFLTVAFIFFLLEEFKFDGITQSDTYFFWFSGPSLFLAFFMLTEPFTMPPSKRLQIGYGALVGFLCQTTLFVPFLAMTPELALVIGNLIFYPSTLKQKLIIRLVKFREVAKDTLEFSFSKPLDLRFRAGQYMEWMLPHANPDNRGIRRYFTISSSPSDPLLKIVVRFGENISTYKQALKELKVGDEIVASQLAGDFVLPSSTEHDVAFIAGGIGITPFISQIDHMKIGRIRKHDTVLFYCNRTVADIAYRDSLQSATGMFPFKIIHVVSDEVASGFEHGRVNAEIIIKHTPDYVSRVWYLSGPPGMVNAYYDLLVSMGVSRFSIHRDFFPGLA